MKNVINYFMFIAIAAILIFSTAACKTEADSGSSGIERGNSAPVVDGIIELEGVTLFFGSNNVTSGAKMTVLKPNSTQKPDGMISGLYEVELNQECDKPVNIRIPVDENTIPYDANAAVLLAIGSRFKDGKNEYTTYNYIPATVSGGLANALFIPANFLQGLIAEGDEGGRKTPFTELFTAYIAVKRVHHNALFEIAPGSFIDGPFAIYSPYDIDGGNEYESTFQSLCADDLEMMNDIYMFFEPYFSYRFNSRTVWPIQVYYDPDFRGGVKYETSTIKYDSANPGSGQIYWNGNPADGIIRVGCTYQGDYNFDSKTYKSKFAHEFCHFLVSTAVQNYNAMRWGDEAFAGLGAKAAGGNFDTEAKDNYKLLFNGLIPKENTSAEGYARSLLLYYIAWRLEQASGKAMAQSMLDMSWVLKQDPDADMDAVLSANTEALVINFYESLIGYSSWALDRAFGIPADYYTDALSGKGSFGKPLACTNPENGKTIAGQITLPISYYGAQFAAVTFNKALLDAMKKADDAELGFTLTGNGEIMLYAIGPQGQILEQEAAIEDIVDKIEEGWKYLVMVIGYEKGTAPVNYTVTVELKDDNEPASSLKWTGPSFAPLDNIIDGNDDPVLLFNVIVKVEDLPQGIGTGFPPVNHIWVETNISSRANTVSAGSGKYRVTGYAASNSDGIREYLDNDNFINWVFREITPGASVAVKIYSCDVGKGIKGDTLLGEFSCTVPWF